MTYLFVQSHTDIGPARGPRLGFVIHMAEGGGTVGYLAKPNPNGVSVHFVIERTGRIVQMLREDHAHSSLRVTSIRTTDDAPPPTPPFGRKAALAVLGSWADTTHGTLGPNHATLAVEIEGFAASGPNGAQAGSLRALVEDLRTRHPGIGLLGHRDFASYKACPGKLIPWDTLGGHGAAQASEDPMLPIQNVKAVAGTVTALTDVVWRLDRWPAVREPTPVRGRVFDALATVDLPEVIEPRFAGDDRYKAGYLVASRETGLAYFALRKDVTYVPPPVPVDGSPFTKRDLDLEFNAGIAAAVEAANLVRRVVV